MGQLLHRKLVTLVRPQNPAPNNHHSRKPRQRGVTSRSTLKASPRQDHVTRFEASAWGWAAVAATVVSAFGYALQTILDYVPAPAALGFAEFWSLFAGAAVLSFLTGVVAVATGWRSRRRDATIAFGLIGVGWLLLAQAIQSAWD